MSRLYQHHVRPRPASELVQEIHDELYRAVFREDAEAAKQALYELTMVAPEDLRTRLHKAERGWGAK
jgi:DNA-binding FadR family transcriptional regulator